MSSSPPPDTAPFRDASITIGLLLAGLWNVTVMVTNARQLPVVLDQTYVTAKIGRYTATELATNIGWAICITQVVSLAIAIGFAVVRIREHKRSFWIPLVVAGACLIVTAILYLIAIVGDPAFLVYISRMNPGTSVTPSPSGVI